MTSDEALEKLLPSYQGYYDIINENVLSPFKVEAKFVSHTEQYIFIKSMKLSDIDSNEHIYFAAEDKLTFEALKEMSAKAWEDGLKTFVPYNGHRNSDVTVVILCNEADDEVMKNCRKIKYSKTYKFMLYGWSNFKLAVADLKTGNIACNYQGRDTKEFIKKFIKKNAS